MQIAHSLGPINGEIYTNSWEAFISSYNSGFRFFEADVVCLKDGKFVLAHPGLEQRYGCNFFEDITIDEFPKTFLGYRTLSLDDLYQIILHFNDSTFILDIKNQHDSFYSEIIKNPKGIIPQLYTQEQICNYGPIFANYIVGYWGYNQSEETFLDQCEAFNVPYVSLNKSYINSILHKKLKQKKCKLIWHGEIYADQASLIIDSGDSAMLDCKYIVNTNSHRNKIDNEKVSEGIINQLYLTLLNRKPDLIGIDRYTPMLTRRQIDVSELAYILSTSNEAKSLAIYKEENTNFDESKPNMFEVQALIESFYNVFYGRKSDSLINEYMQEIIRNSNNPLLEFFLLCKNSKEFKSNQKYIPISGDFDSEKNFTWFSQEGIILVKHIPIYLSIPFDFPKKQRLLISTESNVQETHLEPGYSIKICSNNITKASVYKILCSEYFCPQDENISDDKRHLAFQVSTSNNSVVVMRKKYNVRNNSILLISTSKKEYRLLCLISKGLIKIGIDNKIYCDDDINALKAINNSGHPVTIIIASSNAFYFCEQYTSSAHYIYIEHGIAPFKSYTYGRHYYNYDYLLLPSFFWKTRIESLYSQPLNADVTGYPMLSTIVKNAERDIDALFAPTWSHNPNDFLYLYSIINKLVEAGYRVALCSHPDALESPSLYDLKPLIRLENVYDGLSRAKCVLTDYSSIGLEAATLGIPVLLLQIFVVEDFDVNFYNSERIIIPHSNGKVWDIGETVNVENCVDLLENVLINKSLFKENLNSWSEFAHSTLPELSFECCINFISNHLKGEKKFIMS
jgi:hypothetical protein